MGRNSKFLSVDRSGEIVYHGLNAHISKKYKADTPLDKSFVPYLIMAICAVIDAGVFLSLFQKISYDNPFVLCTQVAAFLFCFDVVPLYLGIQLRRIKQGLNKDRFVLWIGLAVCAIAFAINVVLRITTIDQMVPDLSTATTNYFGAAVQETPEAEINSATIALTISCSVLPLLTSAGSFFISFLLYDPLKARRRTLEEMMSEKQDEIRRLNAILIEYDADEEFAEHLVADDQGKFDEMKKVQRAAVMSYCDLVRQRLKEHLADPTAINALSEETCVAILNRLDQELAALDRAEIPKTYVGTGTRDRTMTSREAAA